MLLATTLETKSPNTVVKFKKMLGVHDSLPTISQQEYFNCLFKKECSQKANSLLDKFFFIANATNELAKKHDVPIVMSILTAGNPQVRDIIENAKSPTCTKDKLEDCEPQKTIALYFKEKDINYIDTLKYVTDENWNQYFFPRDEHATPE